MDKTEPEIILSFQNLVATLPKMQHKPLSDIYQITSSFLWSHRKAFPLNLRHTLMCKIGGLDLLGNVHQFSQRFSDLDLQENISHILMTL